ncbi:MAG: nucleotidyltransferase domain-containing protein [Candidatus Aminicenantes bacterium]|nr:nucleotidyltransferase domain-containing protein [Candidatus Aminicenantes bacterium]
MLKEKLAEFEKRILEEVKKFYGERLVSLVIFGSMGRGTYRPDSDFDLLLIVDKLPKGRMRRVTEFLEIEKKLEPMLISLRKEGIYTELSPILKTPQEAELGSPLFFDMIEDARLLYDQNGFFSRILNRLRQRLKELGARRIWKGDFWYWELKPDYKPCEEFEI